MRAIEKYKIGDRMGICRDAKHMMHAHGTVIGFANDGHSVRIRWDEDSGIEFKEQTRWPIELRLLEENEEKVRFDYFESYKAKMEEK